MIRETSNTVTARSSFRSESGKISPAAARGYCTPQTCDAAHLRSRPQTPGASRQATVGRALRRPRGGTCDAGSRAEEPMTVLRSLSDSNFSCPLASLVPEQITFDDLVQE